MNKFFAALTMTAAMAVVPAFAQGSKVTLRANVPFEFQVGKATMPAGEYEVKDGVNAETLLVKARDGKDAAFSITNPATPPAGAIEAALVFRTTADKHYLEAVWRNGNSRELPVHMDEAGGAITVIKAALVK